MSTTVKTGWLNDKNGNKFAPKTLTSQVITADGVTIENKIATDLDEVKAYADSAAATVKNDLLNGAGAAYDTLKELGDLIDENTTALDALEEVATGKADVEHIHEVSDITDLQATLDSKASQTSLDELSSTVDSKADSSALANYYTIAQIDAMELITVDDIDEICGTTIVDASSSEVTF